MSKKLFVGNLPFSATVESLQDLFAQYGDVHSANIITDRETGRSRGFGFVEMDNAEDAIAALNEKDFEGRALHVSEARERQPRTGGGGGGRGKFRGGRQGGKGRGGYNSY